MNKVFIAEDDEYVSRMYERAFRLHGFEVEVVSSGKIALKRLQEMSQKPSVIVTDALLPEMSGKDLIRRIREDTIFRSIPIAGLTNSFSI
ncbi:MAG: response regulator [Patescibacteria group bacterium]